MCAALSKNNRILLVDDHRPIHDDFRDILTFKAKSSPAMVDLESSFFGDAGVSSMVLPEYELASAYQGQEALTQVTQAMAKDQPFALGFMDVRMPPGWDGIETIRKIWEVDPRMQMVICTAFADYSWEEIFKLFGPTANLVFLRKPFDPTEVRQLAAALVQKWNDSLMANLRLQELEWMVQGRTAELESTVATLKDALENVKTLEGLVPICAACKKVRDDKGYWTQVEQYVAQRTNATFTHGLCPSCSTVYFPGLPAPVPKASR